MPDLAYMFTCIVHTNVYVCLCVGILERKARKQIKYNKVSREPIHTYIAKNWFLRSSFFYLAAIEYCLSTFILNICIADAIGLPSLQLFITADFAGGSGQQTIVILNKVLLHSHLQLHPLNMKVERTKNNGSYVKRG